MIPVTKTFFPPLEEYQDQLQRIWKNEWLTNRGELVLELEVKLKEYLHISNMILTTNGTLPLQIALKVLADEGEVITTPFSYVATTSAIVWENCTPIFVDIHPEYFTIDETKIEEAITDKTTAILATHVFGNPCNVEAIESIANKYNLKVIYDAAHCFGVIYNGKSIFNYGDVSTCSFHATKLFHTGEGGTMITKQEDLHNRLFFHHNFGHNGSEKFHGLGINAKMSELQAAMGLSVLPHMEGILNKRMEVVQFYLNNLDFKRFGKQEIRQGTKWNYSYFAILLQSEEKLLKLRAILEENSIYPRRYFYPSLDNLPYTSPTCQISNDISKRILCLPLYSSLELQELEKIVQILNKALL